MVDKIKSMWSWFTSNTSFFLLAIIGILSAILVHKNKKTDKIKSDLADAITKSNLVSNDKDREYAKKDSDSADVDYARKRAEYDENRTGGGT